MTSDEKDVLGLALHRFGHEAQVEMMVEEAAELLVALCHYRRGRIRKEKVAEELADVGILLEQMVLSFDVEDEVLAYRQAKLARLRLRLLGNPG